MRYMKLVADYTQFPLRDEFSGADFCDSDLIGEDMIAKIEGWNERYRKLLPLDYNEEVLKSGIVLDEEGKALAQEIENLLNGEAKVKYISAI